MRKFKQVKFEAAFKDQAENMAVFINDNNIKQEDIVKIVWVGHNSIYLFYFTED